MSIGKGSVEETARLAEEHQSCAGFTWYAVTAEGVGGGQRAGAWSHMDTKLDLRDPSVQGSESHTSDSKPVPQRSAYSARFSVPGTTDSDSKVWGYAKWTPWLPGGQPASHHAITVSIIISPLAS